MRECTLHAAAISTADGLSAILLLGDKGSGKAQRWFDELIGSAITTTDIARREAVTPSYVARIIKLAFLSPEVVKAIINGRQPAALTAEALINKIEIPTGWAEQKTCLGI